MRGRTWQQRKKNTSLKDSFLLSLETPILDNINRSFECKKKREFLYLYVCFYTHLNTESLLLYNE